MIGPLSSEQLGGDEDVIQVDFEGAYAGVDNGLLGGFVDEQVLMLLNLGGLDQFIRDRVLDDYSVLDELLNLPLDYMG